MVEMVAADIDESALARTAANTVSGFYVARNTRDSRAGAEGFRGRR
jgi:hypothetical protein